MVVNLVGLGSIDRGHLNGRHGLDQMYHVIDVAFLEDAASVYVIGAETRMACHAWRALSDSADILLEEFRDGGFPDNRMNTLAGLFKEFFMVIALVVDADAAHEVFVESFTSCQRAATENGTMVFLREYQGFHGIGVLCLDGFAHEFPDSVAARILMILGMILGRHVIGNRRNRDCVRCLVR